MKNIQIKYDGSGLHGEDDPGSRESVNPDQNRNSVEPPDPSDHPQETHYQYDLSSLVGTAFITSAVFLLSSYSYL